MTRLIDDLLELSRASRAELLVERVDLSGLARAVASDLQARQPGRKVELEIQAGVVGMGDPGLLRRVLENLLANAWKFTGKREDPRIEFGAREEKGTTVYYVRDNGVGFDPAYAHLLFTPFRRLHRESDFPGTGVGLAVVQRIVHRHGGRVFAEGAVGHGATFSFTLPGPGSSG